MATVLDTLITNLRFNPDLKGLRKMETGINRARANLDNLASGFFKAGGILTGALAVTGAKILSFERSWNELTAVFLNESAPALETLRKQALLLGRTTSKSASEAVQAQTELRRSGLDLNQVLASTPAVLNLAIAGNLAMGEAAELVASTLNSYTLEADQATRVTDVFASAASETAFSVGQIGSAFRQAGPLANALNIPFERTVAALGVLRTGGLLPEMAGTGLRNILAILSDAKPPENVIEGFKSIGLNFSDMSKTLKDSGDIIGVMRTMVTAGLDATSALQIFGRESGTAAILLAKGGAGAQELEEIFLSASTTADRMRERMESGLPGAVDQLKSAFEGLLLTLGERGITGALEKAVNMLKGFINSISEAPPQLTKLIASTLLLGPALLAVGAALKAVSIGLGFAMGGLKIFQSGWIYLRVIALESLVAMKVAAVASFGAIRAVGLASLLSIRTAWAGMLATFKLGGVKALLISGFAAIKVAGIAAFALIKGAFLGVVASLLAVSWPVVLGVAAIAAAALLIYKYWEPIKAFFFGFVEGVMEAMAPLGEAFDPIFNMLGSLIGWFGKLFGQTELTAEGFEKAMSAGRIFGIIVGSMIRALLLPIELLAKGIGWVAEKLGLADTSEEQARLEAKQPFLAHAAKENKKALEELRALQEVPEQSAEAIKKLKARIEETLSEGARIESGELPAALEKEFQRVSDLLPQSDAKRGPLSNLMASGRSLVDTLAEGVRRADPLKMALEPILGRLDLNSIAPPLPVAPLPTSAFSGAGAAGSGAGGNKVEMNFSQGAIQINAPGGDAKEIAGHIDQELRDHMRASAEQMDSRIVG